MVYDRRRGGRGGFGSGSGRFGERGGFGRSYDMPKPIKVGEEYDVEISEVGSKGDGIARIKNFVVFVADTKKGDKVKVKVKEVMEKFAIAEKVGAGVVSEVPATEAVEADAEAVDATETAEESEAKETVEEGSDESSFEETGSEGDTEGE